MWRALIFSAVAISSGSAWAAAEWGLGAGLETRVQREVNPDYVEAQSMGQLFAQARWRPWRLHVELGEETRSTSSGGLTIEARSLQASAWGRYEFRRDRAWTPFASLGAGSYFDTVRSSYPGTSDERSGTRPFMGLSGGLSYVAWKYLLLEAETRAAFVQDRADPTVSLLLRVGVQI